MRPSGEQVNITWLAHDVAVWRTDATCWAASGFACLEWTGRWPVAPRARPDEPARPRQELIDV